MESGILKVLAQSKAFCQKHKSIHLSVNIDGVPLFKSTNDQMWPILCSFHTFKPFIVALFCGKQKPDSVTNFLEDFLADYTNLSSTGVKYHDKVFSVCIKTFICDAPARAFLKSIKGHTAYFSCERCCIRGSWNRRVVFNTDEKFPLRKDEDFSEMKYKDHQIQKSPLVDVGINCVSSFVLVYMHLVCLGVVKRMLTLLKTGPRECKISFQHLQQISDVLESLQGKLPVEFARQPRSLLYLDRWKATEFRQFMLYTGPLALKDVVEDEVYEHFLCLTISLSILLQSDTEKRSHYLSYARELLEYFVSSCEEIYGDTFVVYNVHNLVHLADDVSNFHVSLNELSAFKYENHLQVLKKWSEMARIHSPKLLKEWLNLSKLKQIMHRNAEM